MLVAVDVRLCEQDSVESAIITLICNLLSSLFAKSGKAGGGARIAGEESRVTVFYPVMERHDKNHYLYTLEFMLKHVRQRDLLAMMTLAERLHEEGRQKGHFSGRQEGLQQG